MYSSGYSLMMSTLSLDLSTSVATTSSTSSYPRDATKPKFPALCLFPGITFTRTNPFLSAPAPWSAFIKLLGQELFICPSASHLIPLQVSCPNTHSTCPFAPQNLPLSSPSPASFAKSFEVVDSPLVGECPFLQHYEAFKNKKVEVTLQ